MVSRSSRLALLVLSLIAAVSSRAQPFLLPTANRALFEPDGGSKFLVGTVGKTWESGAFGCVRSEGWQLHEGIDIRALQRDKRGEPTDPVMATADGTVVYINAKPALSNYGKYIVVRHSIDGLDVYSLYAHLSEIAVGLKSGRAVKGGEVIAIMGRTANTGEGISRERAHLHFELNFMVNDRFPLWFKRMYSKERNDHGLWNGQNLIGIDPEAVFHAQRRLGARFNLVNHLRSQTELCRVAVRKSSFSWVKRYPALVRPNPVAAKEGIAGYEIALNFNGVPFDLIPRAASELKSRSTYHLLSVNAAEYHNNPCRRLVTPRGARWELAPRGVNLLDLLTH